MRAKSNVARHRAVKRVRNRAKGYWGSRSKLLRVAKETIIRAENFSTVGRKQKKRSFRDLWITRINAAVRKEGMSYSRFMKGLAMAGVKLNRKMLSELAINNAGAFSELIKLAGNQLTKAEV